MSVCKKYHRKSKKGCKTCRQRRVKCDERRPQCTNCLKREESCLWFDDYAEIPKSALIKSSPSQSAIVSFASPTSFCVEPSSSYPLDINNLHLLQHYFTSPYLFPRTSPLLRAKDILPHIGFNHEYFLRALLGFAALHIAISQTDVRYNVDYLSVADVYLDQTKEGLSLAKLENQTPERDAAIFLGWVFVAFYTLARPRSRTQTGQNFWAPKVLDCIDLARRCQMAQHRHSLLVSPLSFMLRGPPREHKGKILPPMEDKGKTFEFPTALLDIHLSTSAAPDAEEVADPLVAAVYEHAVSRLKLSFALDAVCKDSAAGIFAWPVVMSDEFYGYLKNRRPRALVILAHYCVIVERKKGHWWESDLDDNVGKIAAVLDDAWLAFMNSSFLSFREEVL